MTIYDIAEKAGVSITTVSRVLNGKSNVNAQTREKVQQVLSACGYTPNQVARGLANKSTRTIGVMVRDIRDVHHASTAFEVEQALSKGGYSSIVCNLRGSQKRLLQAIDMLTHQQVEGIVLIGSIFEDEACQEEFGTRLANLPVVLANGAVDLPNVYGVVVDEIEGAAMAIDLLAKGGRKRIALVCDDMTHSERCKRRGYVEGMQRNGLGELRMADCLRTIEAGRAATLDLMEQYPDTDAILFSEDITAAGGLRALHDLKLEIPRQIAVVGFNNSIYARLCYPTLTSVDNRLAATGTAAAKLLMNVIEHNPAEKVLRLSCTLAVGEST